MKVQQIYCDRCEGKVPDKMKSINLNGKEVDICSPKCLAEIVVAEYNEKNNVLYIATKKIS